MSEVKVMVSGTGGRMGRTVVEAVMAAEDMELVGGADPAHAGEVLSDLVTGAPETSVAESVQVGIDAWGPEVMVDFTQPEVVMDNLRVALAAGVACVVGTTGFSPEALDEVRGMCERSGTPALIAPNFSIGANLLMKFAEEASRSLDYATVIERHHENKLDAPSGTAAMTVERMAAARESDFRNPSTAHCSMDGVRGADEGGIQVFSVRMQGVVADQEVVFGGLGETLKIEHITSGRECFMPGVLMAVRGVRDRTGLTYGLQALLES